MGGGRSGAAGRAIGILASFSVVLFAGAAHAQVWTSAQQLTDGSPSGRAAVALDPDNPTTAVVSAPSDGQGKVYVYVVDGNGTWTLQQSISPVDPQAQQFGWKVRISGDWLFVGAPQTSGATGASQGAVYVYARSGAVWSLQSTLVAPDGLPGDTFGQTLSYASGTLAIAAKGRNGNAGAVYVFSLAASTSTWAYEQTLTGSGVSRADFGAVTLSPDASTLMVGELFDIGSDPSTFPPGKTWVFARSGGGYVSQQVLTAPGGGSPHDAFGHNVTMDGATAIITATGENNFTGAAYAFTNNGGSWTQTQRFVAPNGGPGDQFGFAAYAHAGVLLLTAPGASNPSGPPPSTGAAYVFKQGANGAWAYWDELFPPDGAPGMSFGQAGGEGCAGTTILIGAGGNYLPGSTPPPHSGYLFEVSTSPGTNVVADGTPGPTGAASSASFSRVSQGGTTTLDQDPSCQLLPPGVLASGASCLSVTTSATYSGGVRVCVPLPSGGSSQVNELIQCDPNPSGGACPAPGLDPRLTTATVGVHGNPKCCGNILGSAPVTDPLCATTQGLSVFAAGKAAVVATSVPLSPWVGPLLAAALILAAARALRGPRRNRR
jgi:hypothetical protein